MSGVRAHLPGRYSASQGVSLITWWLPSATTGNGGSPMSVQ